MTMKTLFCNITIAEYFQNIKRNFFNFCAYAEILTNTWILSGNLISDIVVFSNAFY